MSDIASVVKAPTAAPKPPSRAKVADIIRRYLKKDRTPDWRRECPLWYGLWKQYPSVEFWTRHQLGFDLFSLAWFLTLQGRAQLVSDWAVFHYTPQAEVSDVLPNRLMDNEIASAPPVAPIKRAPRSVADLLSNKVNPSIHP